jgi:hypothetical protein
MVERPPMTLDERLARMRAEGTRAAQRSFWIAVHDELWRSVRHEPDYFAKEELVSRAMTVIVLKIDGFERRGADGCRRWVREIAALELCKRKQELARATGRRQRLREWAAALWRTSPLTALHRQVHEGMVKRLIASMSTRHRDALQFEDARALADARGIGMGAARMRRRRAMRRLADLLDTWSRRKHLR